MKKRKLKKWIKYTILYSILLILLIIFNTYNINILVEFITLILYSIIILDEK